MFINLFKYKLELKKTTYVISVLTMAALLLVRERQKMHTGMDFPSLHRGPLSHYLSYNNFHTKLLLELH